MSPMSTIFDNRNTETRHVESLERRIATLSELARRFGPQRFNAL